MGEMTEPITRFWDTGQPQEAVTNYDLTYAKWFSG